MDGNWDDSGGAEDGLREVKVGGEGEKERALQKTGSRPIRLKMIGPYYAPISAEPIGSLISNVPTLSLALL